MQFANSDKEETAEFALMITSTIIVVLFSTVVCFLVLSVISLLSSPLQVECCL
jgi:hypothetical protein